MNYCQIIVGIFELKGYNFDMPIMEQKTTFEKLSFYE